MSEDDDILAAEFSLGLLDASESDAVQERARTDAALSLRIAWWRDQLAPLVAEVQTPVPADLWPGIAARLPVNDNVTDVRPWKWATAGLGALAAMLLGVIALRPAETPLAPVAPAAPMIAALGGENGTVVAVSYDATTGRMTVAPSTLDPGKGDAELWIIPKGGAPTSLGVIDAKAAASRQLDPVARNLVTPGATFAISREARGGSTTGAPQGPVVATGTIIRT